VPDQKSAAILTDPANPTVVMGEFRRNLLIFFSCDAHTFFLSGADVMHPAPGSTGRPSFTALVGNVDSDTAKYVATSRVQTSKQEMIDDLEDMAKVRCIHA
jgi:eukaryotic translation initiation factor 2C